MMPLSMKTYLALLWGVSVLFSTESMSASFTETSSVNSTAEPSKTTEQLISAHVVYSETETQTDATWRLTHKPAGVSVAATADNTVSTAPPTVETEEEEASLITHRSSTDTTTGLVAMNTEAATASSSDPELLQRSTAVTTAAGEAQPPHSTTISETAKSTGDQLHRQSPTTATAMTAPATASAAVPSSPQPTSTTNPEVTSESPSTTSSTQAAVVIQNLSSPSASATTTITAKPTSDAAPAFDHTSVHLTTSDTSTTSTVVSSPSEPVSGTRVHISTSQFPDPARSSSTAALTTSFSTDSAITTAATVSTSPAGILIPRVPKRGPTPTAESTPATTAATREASKSPPSAEVQPCSTRGIVKKCLIIIASLAGLATIFMVSTIILCAKLSVRKYKVKRPQDTEMMCISALLPERNYTSSRQRNLVTNGVLVIHAGGDSDEDERDNLTLSSFLPENDRLV